MADASSQLPDVLTVAARIPCANTRYCVEFLIQGQIDAKQDNGRVVALLGAMHKDIKVIKGRDGDSPRLFPVPPEMIKAMSRASSASSLSPSEVNSSRSGSSNSRRKRQRDDGLTWVRCPFCEAEHWNEKSHLQHIQRSMER
jgi:hypothetical protein